MTSNALSFDLAVQSIERVTKDRPPAVTDEEAAKCFYSAIDTHLNPLIRKMNEAGEPVAFPPASIVIYTARRFSEPHIKPREIPVLLHILENVEALRRQAVEEADELLLEASKGKKKLKKRMALEKAADESDSQSQRMVFFLYIVVPLIRIYLCYLWKKHATAELWKFMRKTFPSLFIKNESERFEREVWKAATHPGMSIEERETFHEHGKDMKGLLAEMKIFDHEWHKSRALEEAISSVAQYEQAFDERFAKHVDGTHANEILDKYLLRVEKMVNLVEDAMNS